MTSTWAPSHLPPPRAFFPQRLPEPGQDATQVRPGAPLARFLATGARRAPAWGASHPRRPGSTRARAPSLYQTGVYAPRRIPRGAQQPDTQPLFFWGAVSDLPCNAFATPIATVAYYEGGCHS